jgi:hypothetical protein
LVNFSPFLLTFGSLGDDGVIARLKALTRRARELGKRGPRPPRADELRQRE